jgi:hypothetical protein
MQMKSASCSPSQSKNPFSAAFFMPSALKLMILIFGLLLGERVKYCHAACPNYCQTMFGARTL